MVDITSLYPTPEGYATPAQINATREYATALMGSPQKMPIGHWAQGMNAVVNALLGRQQFNNVGQQEFASRMADTMRAKQDPLGIAPPAQPNPGSPGGTGSSFNDAAPTGAAAPKPGQSSDVITQKISQAAAKYGVPASEVLRIAKLESNTGRNQSTSPKGAIGTMQLMPGTATDLGVDPYDQDQNIDGGVRYYAQMRKKFGDPDMAAAAYNAGPGRMDKVLAGKSNMPGETQRYVQNFHGAGASDAGPQGGSAMAFDGSPAGAPTSAANAPGAIAAALAGGNPNIQAAARGAAPRGAAPVAGGPPTVATGTNIPGSYPVHVDPRFLPVRPRVNDQQYGWGMLPWQNPLIQDQTLSNYTMQNQPIQMDVPGGHAVLDRSGQGFAVPTLEKGTLKAGDIEVPGTYRVGPDGQTFLPIQSGGGAMPGGRPAQAPTGGRDPVLDGAPSIAPGSQGAPATTSGTPGKGSENVTSKANQYAALDTGTATDASRNPVAQGMPKIPDSAGPLGVLPPGTNSAVASLGSGAPGGGQTPSPNAGGPGPAGAPPPQAGAQRVAQSVIPQFMWDAKQQSQDMAVRQKEREEMATGTAKGFVKRYDDANRAGMLAEQGLPALQKARTLMDDPRYSSGFFGPLGMDWQRFKAALGGDPQGAVANEVVDKIISGNIVEDMKIMLQGLGQVRNAEIGLLTRATANIYNTPAANKAVLEMMMKVHQRAATLGDMAQRYAQGIRWDNKGQPYRASATPTGLDYGWDHAQQQFLKNNPIFTPEEQVRYDKIFASDKGTPRFDEGTLRKEYGEAVGGRLTKEQLETMPPKVQPQAAQPLIPGLPNLGGGPAAPATPATGWQPGTNTPPPGVLKRVQ